MKVAFAHYSRRADISGVTTWLESLVRRLSADGLEVSVYLHHSGSEVRESSLLQTLEAAGIEVVAVPRAGSLERDVIQSLKFLNEARPSVFLPQCLSAHYFAATIAGQQGLPWALAMHSDDPRYWAMAGARQANDYGGGLVCVSDYLVQTVAERALDNRPTLIPYGVEAPSESTAYRRKPFRVVFSGRLEEKQKRLSLVTDALKRACLSDPLLEATIIGDGPSLAMCRRVVAEASLESRIRFTGRLTSAQVRHELLDAQAILFMSDFEGLPVALLEAMAAGVVPVARWINSGIPELVLHNQTGLLIGDEAEAAALALCRLASDRALWERCSLASRQLVEARYAEETSYRRWLALIHVLDQRSKVRYPLQIPRRLGLPLDNPHLRTGYPPHRPLWRRVGSRLKREVKMALSIR